MAKSDALYRKEHWFTIRLKNHMYKRLPCTRKLIRASNRRRKDYYRNYYEKNKERLKDKSRLWIKQNKDRRKLHWKRYDEKRRLKLAGLKYKPQIKRIVKEFLQYCKDRHKERTTQQYTMNINRFLSYIERPGARCKEYHCNFYYDSRKTPEERNNTWRKKFHKILFIKEIDKNLITDYVSYVNYDAINSKGLKLNQSEKESRLYPLKAFILYCQRRDYLKKDLRKFVIVPPREKKIPHRLMTVDEMSRFLESSGDEETVRIRDRALLELSYSGFRANELLSLKIKDVDLDTNAVTIVNAKGNKDRVVPMTNEAIYWIKRWLSRRNEFIGGRSDPEYLFITSGLRPIRRRQFATMIKKYAKKTGVQLHVSPHDLRRVTATHLAENGAPIRLIQALLGHTTLKVTTKYLRLTDEKIKKEHKETHPSNRRNLYYGRVQR